MCVASQPASQSVLCPRLLIVCAGEELEPWKGLTVGSTRTKNSQFDLQGWTGLGWGILVCFRPAQPSCLSSPLLPSPSSSSWYCWLLLGSSTLLLLSSSYSPAQPSSPVRPSPGPGFPSPALPCPVPPETYDRANKRAPQPRPLGSHQSPGTWYPPTQPSSQAANSAAETQPLILHPSFPSPLHARSTQCVARGVRS